MKSRLSIEVFSSLRSWRVPLVASLLLGAGLVSAGTPDNAMIFLSGGEQNGYTLDPALAYDSGSGAVLENIYETLVTFKGKSLQGFEPLLATAWTTSSDKKTYTFTLRKNVKFHSGSTMACEDAEYSFERALVTNNAASAVWFLAESLLGTSANAKDDPTITWARIDSSVSCTASGQLVFKLPEAEQAFIAKLAYFGFVVYEKKWAVENGEWGGTEKDWKDWVGKNLEESYLNLNTNGTGAYTVTQIKPELTVFTRFNDYWGGAAKIERIVWQQNDAEDGRVLAIKKGDADSVGIRPVLLEQVKDAPGVNFIDNLPDIGVTAINMNQKISGTTYTGSGKLDGKGIPANFFSDVHVRRCFAHVYDVNTFIKEALLGRGKMLTMAMNESFLGYDASIPYPKFDLEKAKAECKLAWKGELWKKGFNAKAVYGGGREPTSYQIIRANLSKINPKFRLEAQRIQSSEFNDESKLPINFGGWIPDYLDTDNMMYGSYYSKGYQAAKIGFKDATIDNLIERARKVDDPKTQAKLYAQVGRRGAELMPFLMVPQSIGYAVLSSKVKGYKENFNPMRSGGVLWKEFSK
jgi:peptide/nickel transport system substrate-binding protein